MRWPEAGNVDGFIILEGVLLPVSYSHSVLFIANVNPVKKNLWRLGSNNQGEKSVAQERNVVYSPFLDTCRHKQVPFLGALPQPKTHCKSTVPNLVLPDRRCTLEKNELP